MANKLYLFYYNLFFLWGNENVSFKVTCMYISKNEKKKKDVKLFYYHLLNINESIIK